MNMKFPLLTIITVSALVVFSLADTAYCITPEVRACRRAPYSPWHTCYYHAAWGMPVALVVPPTAEYQTHFGWGVGNTRITANCPQFERNWPGPGYYNSRAYRPTPRWPSDTDQFGVNYVRGPW